MDMAGENIVMFPFMAQGHMIPFLALANQILRRRHRRDCTVTFVNTPLNVAKLRSSLPPDSSIRLLELPFSAADHGLPPGTENTDALHYPLIYRLIEASVSLRPAFRHLVSGLVSREGPPLCIISDMFFSWSAEVAREFGVFHAIFCGGGGFGFACYYSLWLNLPHKGGAEDSQEEGGRCFRLPDFHEAGAIHGTQLAPALSAANRDDSWTRFQATWLPNWASADAMLFNTVEGIDGIGLDYFRRKLNKPVWAIGPVLLASPDRARSAGTETGMSPESCRKWLDEKPPNSVLYVSFGSQNTPSASQMMQLAMALEGSGRNFIWVLRPPLGFDLNSEFNARDWLPEGFEERIADGESGRGLLVQRWAPQVEILSHRSISAFLSHGGWNSVLESLSRGVPIIGWPMAAEQFYNVKYLEEKLGVCVEVARGNNSPVSREDIQEKIELVMGEEQKGKVMRRKAREAMGMITDAIREDPETGTGGGGGGYKGSSVKAMDELLDAARSRNNKLQQQHHSSPGDRGSSAM